MTAFTLSLPYPPSTNRLWRYVNGRAIKSEEYRIWQKEAAQWLMVQFRAWRRIDGPYCMSVEAERPDRRRRDLSNLIKATEDCLVDCGVISDDSLAERIIMEWSAKEPAKPGLLNIVIRPYSPASPAAVKVAA